MDHAHTSGAVGVAAYDTTLRDGAQQQSVSFTVEDKLAVARLLDALGVAYIEAGWPGAIPKDTELFGRVRDELDLRTARLVAFGSTCRPGAAAADDPQVRALIDSGAPVITIVAKSDPVHVERALRTTREENLRMVRETVGVLLAAGREVMVDLEHYFDGLRHDPGYGLRVALTAARAGAGAVIACDTNGGTLPDRVGRGIGELRSALDEDGRAGCVVGIHTHDDAGVAVAGALAAVEAGARQVQGCVNGFGERTGNANLLTLIADLELKTGWTALPGDDVERARRLTELSAVSRTIGEIARADLKKLTREVGERLARHLHDLANGRDDRPVEPVRKVQSIGREITFPKDLRSPQEAKEALLKLAGEVGWRLRRAGQRAHTVQLKLRLGDFSTFTRQRTFDVPLCYDEDLYEAACALFDAMKRPPGGIRLLGISGSGFDEAGELSLFDDS
nr:citramalate synthase [Propionibacterium acidifaciens]